MGKAAQCLAQRNLIDFDPYEDMEGAQCVHGQIHEGNVLFINGNPVLFDTENGINTFAPKMWDYSWLLQRFIINQEIEKKQAIRYFNYLARNSMKLENSCQWPRKSLSTALLQSLTIR